MEVGTQEAGDPAVALLRVGLGEDQRHLGVVAERDPHLLAVDPPAAVLESWARVRIDDGSEPASGSERPKQPSASPEHRRGSQWRFCSSVPQRSIEPQTSEVWTETTVRAEESPRPTSSTIRP